METFRPIRILILLVSLSLIACESTSGLEEELEAIRATRVPDARTTLFDYSLDRGILRGRTTSRAVFEEVAALLRKKHAGLVDSLYLLPHYSLGSDTLGIVTVSVANIRSEPRHSAELSTQALMGTPVRLLQKTGNWYLIQTPDHYLGYMESGVLAFNSTWLAVQKRVFNRPSGFVRENATSADRAVADVSLGNLLEIVEDSGAFATVRLPDGRMGVVNSSDLSPISQFIQREPDLFAASSRFLGVPYLWGGTSFKGVDCSGFTRILFMDEGIYLPRDASQQALAGDNVRPDSTFSSFAPGDLLFFGRDNEHISHVAVYLGNKRFIHSSGWVRYGSFDPRSEEFDEYNLNRFRFAKRVLNSASVEKLNNETFYNP